MPAASKTFAVSFKENGFRRVSRKMSKMGDEAEDTGDSLNRAGMMGKRAITAMTAAITGAVAGIGKLTSSAAKYASEVDNAAEQSGMAAERIQEVAYAAEQTSGANFDQVRDGLKELALRSEEAAQGTGEAAEAFERLEISQSFLQDASTAEVFRRLRQELQGASKGMRTFVAETTLGGEAGEKMVEVLGLSNQEMQQMRQEARATGQVMSSEQVEALDKTRKEWDKLTGSLKGLGREIATDLLPITRDLIGELKNLTSWMGDLDEETRKTVIFGGGAALAVGPAIGGVQRLTTAVKTLYATVTGASIMSGGGLGALLTGSFAGGVGLAAIMDTTSAAGQLSDRTQDLTRDFTDLRQELQNVEGSEVPDKLEEIRSQHQRISGTVGAVTAKIQKREKRLEQLRKQREEVSGAAQRGIQQTIERKKTELQNLKEEQSVLKGLMNALSRLRSEWKDVGGEVETTGDKAQKAAEKLRQAAQEASPVTVQGTTDVETPSIADSIPGTVEGPNVSLGQLKALSGAADNLRQINTLIQATRQNFNTLNNVEARTFITRLQQQRAQMSAMKSEGIRTLTNIGQSLGTVISQAVTFSDEISNLGDVFSNMWQEVKDIIKRLIARLIGMAFVAALVGPMLGISDSSFGSIFKSLVGGKGIPGLDKGGFIESGGLAMLHKGEMVVPAAQVSSPDISPGPLRIKQEETLETSISLDELIFRLDRRRAHTAA